MSLNKKISFETEICENITPRWLYAEGGTACWNTSTASFVRPILRPNAAKGITQAYAYLWLDRARQTSLQSISDPISH